MPSPAVSNSISSVSMVSWTLPSELSRSQSCGEYLTVGPYYSWALSERRDWLEAQVEVCYDGVMISEAISAADCARRQGENAGTPR